MRTLGQAGTILLTLLLATGALAQAAPPNGAPDQGRDNSGEVIDGAPAPTTSGRAIPRQDPSGGEVRSTESAPSLPPRPLTAAEIEAIRRGMVDESSGVMLRPGEVGRVRDNVLGSQSAAHKPTYSGDPYPVAAPRVVEAAKSPMQTPPVARLHYGLTTSITFVDREGYPWPVANVTYNPRVMAQDGAGCGGGGGGNAGGDRPTTINLTPCYFEVFSNVNVALEEWPYPVVLLTQSGFRPEAASTKVVIDMPLTVVIDGRSPLAEKVKPLPIKKGPSKPVKIAKVVSGDRDLSAYMTGSPPPGARRVTISGAPELRGYMYEGRLVVVGPVDILAPSYNSRAGTPTGDAGYRFDKPPVRLLIQDRMGRERSATVEF